MNKQRLGYIEGWLSILVNTILFAVKLWAGLASYSIAMVADAWHTMSDSITSVIVIAGLWMSGKSPDEEHPFGHGRIESIGAIIIATILAVIGVNFLKDAILKLGTRQYPKYGTLAVIVFIISAIVKEILARFSIWAGKVTDSKSLKADGWHHRSDAITTAIIIAGIYFGRNLWWIDSVLGILVSILIIYTAYEIIKDVANSFIGGKVGDLLERQIKDLICATSPVVKDIHHLHMHTYGDHRELTLHICLPDEIQLKEAHEITNDLEDAIRAKLNIETTIHIEPELSLNC
jgi:cation diffusion facilitator family transporter